VIGGAAAADRPGLLAGDRPDGWPSSPAASGHRPASDRPASDAGTASRRAKT
jgi:hypothetical protein